MILCFLQTLFKPEVILTNLLPYTQYIVKVEARNQFTLVSTGGYLFGDSRENRTLEGGKLKYRHDHHLSSYIIIYHIIYHHLSYHLSSCIIMYHHISSSIIMYHHVSSYIII